MYDMFCNAGDTPYKRRHCDRCGKCFTKNTFLKMHKFRHSGAKPFLQEKLGVLRESVSKTNFPDDSHVLLTQKKRLTNSWLWYLWKMFYKKHCHDDAQISPLAWRCANIATVGRSHFCKENCEFCEQMYSTPTSQTSPMLTHTGEKLYKRRSVICVENIFLNHWPEDAQI